MAYATFENLTTAYSVSLIERIAVRAGDDDPIPPALAQERAELALDAASGLIDSYLQNRYAVPVVTVSTSLQATLRACACAMAVSDLVLQKGYVEGSEDESLVKGALQRWVNKPNGWLWMASQGQITLPGVSSVPDGSAGSTGAPDGFLAVSEEPFFADASKFR